MKFEAKSIDAKPTSPKGRRHSRRYDYGDCVVTVTEDARGDEPYESSLRRSRRSSTSNSVELDATYANEKEEDPVEPIAKIEVGHLKRYDYDPPVSIPHSATRTHPSENEPQFASTRAPNLGRGDLKYRSSSLNAIADSVNESTAIISQPGGNRIDHMPNRSKFSATSVSTATDDERDLAGLWSPAINPAMGHDSIQSQKSVRATQVSLFDSFSEFQDCSLSVLKACDTCRTRKVRCDEGKPSCRNCLENDQQCYYREPPGRRINHRATQVRSMLPFPISLLNRTFRRVIPAVSGRRGAMKGNLRVRTALRLVSCVSTKSLDQIATTVLNPSETVLEIFWGRGMEYPVISLQKRTLGLHNTIL